MVNKISDRLNIFRLDIIKKNGGVKIIVVSNGLGPDHDPLTGDPPCGGPAILFDRQQQMDLQLRHRFDVRIDPTVHSRRTEVTAFSDDVNVPAG